MLPATYGNIQSMPHTKDLSRSVPRSPHIFFVRESLRTRGFAVQMHHAFYARGFAQQMHMHRIFPLQISYERRQFTISPAVVQ